MDIILDADNAGKRKSLLQVNSTTKSRDSEQTSFCARYFEKSENSEQILNITENSEQILKIAEHSEHY